MTDYDSKKDKLIKEALEAEEYFTLDELEEYANSLRKKKADEKDSSTDKPK